MKSWLAVVLAGCGFQHGTAPGVGPSDGPRDAPADVGDAHVDAPGDAFVFMDAPTTGISFVQGHSFGPGLNAALVADTFPSMEHPHDLNLVVVSWTGVAASVTSVSDTATNTYTRIGSAFSQGTEKMDVFYAADIAAAVTGNTVTAAFDGVVAGPEIRILEYAGLATSSPLDATNTGQAHNTKAVTTGTATTTHANDLLVGCETSTDSVKFLGTGYTLRVSAGGDIVEDRIVTTTGSYTADATLFNNADWMMRIVALEGAN